MNWFNISEWSIVVQQWRSLLCKESLQRLYIDLYCASWLGCANGIIRGIRQKESKGGKHHGIWNTEALTVVKPKPSIHPSQRLQIACPECVVSVCVCPLENNGGFSHQVSPKPKRHDEAFLTPTDWSQEHFSLKTSNLARQLMIT